MWFHQYGRTWLGPWFLVTDTVVVFYAAGIMVIADLPTTALALKDTDGHLHLADR